MEEPLLGLAGENQRRGTTRDVFVEEIRRVSCSAMPMVVVTLSQHMLRVASIVMLGHLGRLSLSATAIATSLTNVTGFSLLFGMAAALETLCGQAYGAQQYDKLGTYAYGAIISPLLACLPIAILWMFMENILISLGQDPLISAEAGRYTIWLIPTLFPYRILQSLVRYFQTQSLIFPMLLSSVAALCFHVPVCGTLVFKLRSGNTGAALAIGLSYWFNVLLLGAYMKRSSSREKTRLAFSKDIFRSTREFFRFAIPSVVMIWYVIFWNLLLAL